MKHTAMVALLVVLVCGSAQAANEGPGIRVGGAISFGDFSWDDDRDLIDDNSVGFKVHAQYHLNDWLAVEGAYHNTSEFEDRVLNSTDPSTPDGTYEISFSGFSGALVGFLPVLSEDLRFYGKVGYYDFDDELTVSGQVNSNGSEDGLMLGGGFALDITERVGVRADVDWFDADVGDLLTVNIGIEYSFGGSGIY